LKLEIVSSPLDVGNRWAEDVIQIANPPPRPNDSAPLTTAWVILVVETPRASPFFSFLVSVQAFGEAAKLPAAPLSNFQNVDRPTRVVRNPPGMRGWVTVSFGTVPRRLGLNRGE
jgi:hypothetical protein